MNQDTGEMKWVEDVMKLPEKEQKKYVPIPNIFLPELEGMNRHERRKWLKLNRKRVDKENQRDNPTS